MAIFIIFSFILYTFSFCRRRSIKSSITSLPSSTSVSCDTHKHMTKDKIEELQSLWSYPESIDELKFKINQKSPVDSIFDKFSSPEFSNINTNTSFVQNHRHEMMLSEGFQTLQSVPEIDHATLMMDNMVHGKALPQKGNLLQTVMEAGPLLQTLLVANPLPVLSHMTFGSGTNLNFDNVNFGNFGLVEKRQRFQ